MSEQCIIVSIYLLNIQLCPELVEEANERTEWSVIQQRHLKSLFGFEDVISTGVHVLNQD